MRYRATTGLVADERLDAVVVPVLAGGVIPGEVLRLLGPFAADVSDLAARTPLAEPGSIAHGGFGAGRPIVVLAGVGSDRATGFTADALRTSVMAAARAADASRVGVLMGAAVPDDPHADELVAESWVIGSYHFGRYMSVPPAPEPAETVFWTAAQRPVDAGVALGSATNRTRDLVNTPPGDLTPAALADHCRDLGRRNSWRVTVLEADDLEAGGFGGLLAVGAGSRNPPLLVEIERGPAGRPHVALVGKGITFDSGGLSLKPTRDMLTMKADMSGAAAVVNAVAAIDELDADIAVRGYLACAENMPGGSAMRIGDVLRHRNGVTCEVVDTDCEGRLVLGDALAYAVEQRPELVVDVATLTSSTGLGPEIWGLLGTDDALAEALLDAGRRSGEPGWRLPLWAPYAARLRSEVADLRNYDPSITSAFGAVLAAQYLRRFVGDVPWAHIDLGLTVMVAPGNIAWRPGANGNATRTLARFLRNRDRRAAR